jgi:hypothetical protein
MKTILIALAFVGMLASPAAAQATCDLYYQYDYSKTIVQDMSQSDPTSEVYIIEGMEEVDAFISEVNAKTGSTIPLGTADALLGFVDGNGMLLLFGYKDGCQVGHTKVQWV